MNNRLLPLIAGIGMLLIPGMPVLAGSQDTGRSTAATKIQTASERLATTLTGLHDTLPESARAAIDKAIAASSKGFETAMAALTGDGSDATAPEAEASTDSGAKPEVTGLQKARESVSAAFQKSVDALTQVAGKVPADVQDKVAAALARVMASRATALDHLDQLIGGEHPGPAMVPPERPDHPAAPEHAELPELPDRPDVSVPEKPEIPERPNIPDRPQVPDRPERP